MRGGPGSARRACRLPPFRSREHKGSSTSPRSTVIFERLGLLAGFRGLVLEDVNQANGGVEPFDASLDQCEVGIIPLPELIEPLGLGLTDVTWSRTAGGVGILVKADQRLPMFVAGALDRGADLLPGQRHVRVSGAAPSP
jgi:hypothetical protein